MEKKKLTLDLTHLGLHSRSFRPVSKLENAIEGKTPDGLPYGRLFSPGTIGLTPIPGSPGKFEFVIPYPPDIRAQIERGELEVEFIMPEGGLMFYAGKDLTEKAAQLKKKARNKKVYGKTHVRRFDKNTGGV